MIKASRQNEVSAPIATAWVYIAFFSSTILLYGYLTFEILPPNLFIKYQVAAKKFISGTLATERLMDFSPIYLRVHILAEKFLNRPGTGVLWLQILLSSLSAVLLFELMRSFYRFSISLAGTFLFITHQSVILYTATFEPEPFAICFILGFLVTSLKRSKGWAFIAGLFLSLSLLTRQNFFLLILLTPVFFMMRDKGGRNWGPMVASFLIPVLLTVSVLSVRNSVVTGSMVPYANHPGNVFFEGNNPNSYGQSAIYPPLVHDIRKDFPFDSDIRHVLYRLILRRGAEQPVAVTDVNAYWSVKALHFMLDHPVHALKRLTTKLTYIFHQFPRHDIPYLYDNGEKLTEVMPRVPFALISALALIGMILSAVKWRDHFLIYLTLFSQVGIMFLTYVSERQRVAIISLMIFFAAKTVHSLLFDGRRRFAIGAFLIFLASLLYVKNDLMHDEIHVVKASETYTRLKQESVNQRASGNLKLAARANALAYSYAPWYTEDTRLSDLSFDKNTLAAEALETALLYKNPSPQRLFDLATLFVEAKRYSEGAMIMNYLIEGGFRFNRRMLQSSEPHFHLARIHEMQGDRVQAISSLNKALARNPGDPWVLSHLKALTGRKIHEEKLVRYFGQMDAAYFMGKAYYATGRFDDAVDRFTYVVRYLPEYRKAKIYLSLSLGGTEKYRNAAETYLEAIGQRPDEIFGEEAVLHIFKNWTAQDPRNEMARRHLETILKTLGRYDEALEILKNDSSSSITES